MQYQQSIALKIHLWVYNHPFRGISDQVEFFLASFRQHGYIATVGQRPVDDALNVVIENFDINNRDKLIEFCKNSCKRVCVIMTEHVDFLNGNVFIHGSKIWTSNDYMHPATQVNRLRCLVSLAPWVRGFFVLGDLPELCGFNTLLPGIPVRPIPFPKISYIEDTAVESSPPAYDLLFTGASTAYRDEVETLLNDAGFMMFKSRELVSRAARNKLNRSTRLTVNIPQRQGWRWLSLMRIMASLSCGRATVSINTNDTSCTSACTEQLNLTNSGWTNALRDRIDNWHDVYRSSLRQYEFMIADFEAKHPFPHDLIEYWAITDGVKRY